jgi:hypothetical protein
MKCYSDFMVSADLLLHPVRLRILQAFLGDRELTTSAHFDRYLARGDIDIARDGVSYRVTGLWLDDAELAELLREVARMFEAPLASRPAPGRKLRILGTILLPGGQPEAAGSQSEAEES